MKPRAFSVRVPATTANLGPGFDCAALALSLYMEVEAVPSKRWEVAYQGEEYAGLESGEDNLIVRTVKETAALHGQTAPPCRLSVKTEIPLGKGLGSSATAVAAGVEIADRLLGLGLSLKEKVQIGSGIEGHADNVVAALMGGATFSHYRDGRVQTVHIPDPRISGIVLVPDNPFSTEESRGLLPGSISHREAVAGGSASGVLAAAFAVGDWETAGRMMEEDVFHEPYRSGLFPDFGRIRSFSRSAGAFGTAVSGAGPSIFILTAPGTEEAMAGRLEEQFPSYRPIAVRASSEGAAAVAV
ncbi:homoserine kinase [Bhargavaea cecembensis]|uniref:homoserine kinase n=1 Tax=Bhargavaea cecembensis TaxID=394098 RepID=UPI00058B9E5E|nr:homoserine kinase [Bhargavaea cecembensis]